MLIRSSPGATPIRAFFAMCSSSMRRTLTSSGIRQGGILADLPLCAGAALEPSGRAHHQFACTFTGSGLEAAHENEVKHKLWTRS